MKKEIADEWVKALRSGEYVQGQNMLKYEDPDTDEMHHCCLGVLCEIAIENGVELEVESRIFNVKMDDRGYMLHKAFMYDDLSGLLPERILQWSGVRSPEGKASSGFAESLAEMNDALFRKGKGFGRISDFIEKHWEEL